MDFSSSSSSLLILIFIIIITISTTTRSQLITTKTINNKTFETFSFTTFHSMNNNTNLTALKDSTFDERNGALQITPDTTNNPTLYLVNTSGRVLLPTPVTLWQTTTATNATTNITTTSNYVATFNTSFDINVYRVNNATPGEGMAFVIVPNLDAPLEDSSGGYLGLASPSTDGDPGNQFVAIEFDTFKQSFDPDDNHVGLDINSVKSSKTTNLTQHNITLSPKGGIFYRVWIDYDGAARSISVYMVDREIGIKPSQPLLYSLLDLSLYVANESYIGFSASTGTTYELNCVLSWNLTVEKLYSENSSSNRGMAVWKVVLISVGAAFVVAFLIVCLWYILYVKRRRAGLTVDPRLMVEEKLRSLPGTPREFDFKELKKATNNFDDKMKLGQGGFGVVYKGVLPVGEDPSEIAVKKFSRDSSGMDDFLKELTIINRLRHKHLVRLVGWCYKNAMLLLVYEFMPQGSLDQHLFAGPEKPLLSWHRRYKIVEGVASALHYLHNEYDQKVVHRDLKPSNIMLDSSFNARLGDFGLARAIDTDKTSYAENELGGVPGTLGYIAPECFHTGKATRVSDVFSFGAVVLEVVSGRRPRCEIDGFQFLTDWVWKLHREGRILDAVDPRLDGDVMKDDAKRLLLLGLACCHPIPCDRPKTEAIVQIVSKSVDPPVVPPFKPAFMWPAGPIDDEDQETSRTLTSASVTFSCNASSSM